GLKYLPAEAAFPAGVLVSPDGQSLPLAFGKSQQTFRESLVAALDEIVSSPKRDEIVQRVTRDYAAILLIEGPNADENGRARKAIAEAIKQIGGQLSALPKVIAHAPSLLVLDPASFARERVLLWSLGLSPEKITQTRAAVIYGKARWIGPLMKDEEINEGNLSRLLSIIGADCECGLDISWTQGTRLPVRWDEKLHAQLAKALSFDPENPLVKIEVGRIVGRRNESTTARERNQEQTLNVSTSDGFRESSAASDTNKVPPPREQGRGPTPPLPTVAETAPLLHSSLLITAGLAFVALSAGAWIFLREARRRRRE
ncbi:MAG TPA: hypothetical protein VFA77_16800, partial [Candidatus Eisenbacteria bacterium]|nr:hypothetical protein [Candidatus Eisenbacteria bacterium]